MIRRVSFQASRRIWTNETKFHEFRERFRGRLTKFLDDGFEEENGAEPRILRELYEFNFPSPRFFTLPSSGLANYPALDRRPLRGRPVVTGGGHFLQNRSNSRPFRFLPRRTLSYFRGNNPSLHGIPLPLSWKNWIPNRSSAEEDNDFNKNLGMGETRKRLATKEGKNFGDKKKNPRDEHREEDFR